MYSGKRLNLRIRQLLGNQIGAELRLLSAMAIRLSKAPSRSYEPLARRLCKGVYDLAGGKHSQWVSVSKISQHIKVKDVEMLDGAISFAAQKAGSWSEASRSIACC